LTQDRSIHSLRGPIVVMAVDGWGSQLSFLAVGRVKDSTTLAYHIATDVQEQQTATKEIFTKLLAAAATKLTAGQRTRLQWNDGSVCCLMDAKGENLYCVVTSLLTYPERLAYQLLYDLVASTSQMPDLETCPENGLNEDLGPKMKELVAYYEDAKNFPQLALGMSRESLASNVTKSFAEPDGTGRRKLMVGIIVLLVIIVIIVIASQTAFTAVADVATKDVAVESAVEVVVQTGVSGNVKIMMV